MGRFVAFGVTIQWWATLRPLVQYKFMGGFAALGFTIQWWATLRPLAQYKLMGCFAAFGQIQVDGPLCGPWSYYTMVGRITN